jgi:hypothetical protein
MKACTVRTWPAPQTRVFAAAAGKPQVPFAQGQRESAAAPACHAKHYSDSEMFFAQWAWCRLLLLAIQNKENGHSGQGAADLLQGLFADEGGVVQVNPHVGNGIQKA